MSKKTNAAKQRAKAAKRRTRKHGPKHKWKPRIKQFSLISEAELIRDAELLAFGTIGCALLRALNIPPFSLLGVPPEGASRAPEESGKVPTDSQE